MAFSHEVLYLIHDLARHAENAERLYLPALYSLDDVIGAFTAAGVETAASRLKIGFVPLSDHARSFPADLSYFYEHKVMLRFTRPPA